MLKTETTQKVKLARSPIAHRDVTEDRSPVTIPGKPLGLAKFVALFGNHRNHASAVIFGLAVSIGISSFPTNYVNTAAAAQSGIDTQGSDRQIVDPAATANPDAFVNQLHNDIATMRSQHPQAASMLLAQSISVPRAYPSSFTNRTDNNLRFGTESSIPIDVPAPRTRNFKVPTTQAFNPNVAGTEGELDNSTDRNNGKTGETTISFSWPAAGTLTSRYGRRWGRMHKGIDIAGPIGTPIAAAADGVVIAAGWSSGGYGNLVEVRHIDGTTTRYGHNSRLSVSIGQSVRQGQQVAEMGSSGHSTGPHLHFEIRPSGGAAVNPIAHLPANS